MIEDQQQQRRQQSDAGKQRERYKQINFGPRQPWMEPRYRRQGSLGPRPWPFPSGSN